LADLRRVPPDSSALRALIGLETVKLKSLLPSNCWRTRLLVAAGLVEGAFVGVELERVGLRIVLRSPRAWIVAEFVKGRKRLRTMLQSENGAFGI
jgi:hypothetical protein